MLRVHLESLGELADVASWGLIHRQDRDVYAGFQVSLRGPVFKLQVQLLSFLPPFFMFWYRAIGVGSTESRRPALVFRTTLITLRPSLHTPAPDPRFPRPRGIILVAAHA